MSFDDFPVFLLPSRSRPVKDDHSSRRLPRPSKALTSPLPAALVNDAIRLAPDAFTSDCVTAAGTRQPS